MALNGLFCADVKKLLTHDETELNWHMV